MTLKDGKFYKDGEPYPLEFGNNDQIALLDKREAELVAEKAALEVKNEQQVR